MASLKSKTKKSNSDFLSWDDLNLSELFDGEYTDYYLDDSDSEFESEKSEKSESKLAMSVIGYVCPHCSKTLKTISGFRGHVSRQHNDTSSKGMLCLFYIKRYFPF
jgi:hypothetical protein